MFIYDSVLYPFGSIPALCHVAIAVYYLCTGDTSIYARGTKFLYSFLFVTFCRWRRQQRRVTYTAGMTFVLFHYNDGNF